MTAFFSDNSSGLGNEGNFCFASCSVVTDHTYQTCRCLCFKGDFSEIIVAEVCKEFVPTVASGPGTSL